MKLEFKPEEVKGIIDYYCSNYGSRWSDEDIQAFTEILNARLEEMLKECHQLRHHCRGNYVCECEKQGLWSAGGTAPNKIGYLVNVEEIE